MAGILDLLDDGSSLSCGGWWDAYDATFISGNGTVTIRSGTTDRVDAITDKSGDDWTLSNAESSDADHPQLIDGALRFDENGDHHLKNASFSQDWDSVTMFASFTFNDDPHHTVLVGQGASGTAADFMIMLRQDTDPATTMDWQYKVGNGSAITTNSNIVGAFTAGIKRVVTFIVHPTATDTVRLRISSHTSADDVAVTNLYDATIADTSSSGGMLGSATVGNGLWVNAHSSSSATHAYTAGIDLHELALFDGACSATEISRIENYMLSHGPPQSPTQTQPGIGLSINSRR